MKSQPLVLIFIFAVIFPLVSCKKDYLSKSDSKSLFAQPTSTELEAVYAQWQERDLLPADYRVIGEAELLPGAYRLKVISFRLGQLTEYAILVVPESPVKVPVQIQVGGFGLDVTHFTVNLVLNDPGSGATPLIAMPALRGQSLEVVFNGKSYKTPRSDGIHCDAFDGATDDVLTLLNLVEQTEPGADVNRTGVRGGSRGGTVALLAAIRDNRIKRVIDVVGPVNLLELTASHENDPTYQCQFLTDYKSGKAPLAAARAKMISSSPFYFAERLPSVQLHLGSKDTFVPVKQGYDLQQKMEGLPNKQDFRLFIYDRSHTDLVTGNPDFNKRTGDFFAGL